MRLASGFQRLEAIHQFEIPEKFIARVFVKQVKTENQYFFQFFHILF